MNCQNQNNFTQIINNYNNPEAAGGFETKTFRSVQATKSSMFQSQKNSGEFSGGINIGSNGRPMSNKQPLLNVNRSGQRGTSSHGVRSSQASYHSYQSLEGSGQRLAETNQGGQLDQQYPEINEKQILMLRTALINQGLTNVEQQTQIISQVLQK